MIYLNNAAQHKVLHNFHYALLPKGFLALGRSESVNSAGDLFTPGGKEDKLYTKRKTAAAVHFSSLGRRKEPKDQLDASGRTASGTQERPRFRAGPRGRTAAAPPACARQHGSEPRLGGVAFPR
jgi:hypothetical protein